MPKKKKIEEVIEAEKVENEEVKAEDIAEDATAEEVVEPIAEAEKADEPVEETVVETESVEEEAEEAEPLEEVVDDESTEDVAEETAAVEEEKVADEPVEDAVEEVDSVEEVAEVAHSNEETEAVAEEASIEEKADAEETDNLAAEEEKPEEPTDDTLAVAEDKAEVDAEEKETQAADAEKAAEPTESVAEGRTQEPTIPKEKKPSKFGLFVKAHKKLVAIISIVLILAVAGVATGLILTRNNVAVSEAADLYEALEKGRGKVIVLKQDVTIDGDVILDTPYDINLKGHTLKVTGKLVYNLGDSDKSVTVKTDLLSAKKENQTPGKLEVGEFEFNGVNAELVFYSAFLADKATISAKTAVFERSVEGGDYVVNAVALTMDKEAVAIKNLTATGTDISIAAITAEDITVNASGKAMFGKTLTADDVVISATGDVELQADVKATTISVSAGGKAIVAKTAVDTAQITAVGDVELFDVKADTLTLSGKNVAASNTSGNKNEEAVVTISAAELARIGALKGSLTLTAEVLRAEVFGEVSSIVNGNQVYVLSGAAVGEITGTSKVVVGLNATAVNLINVDNLIIQEKLLAPATIVMDDTTSTPGITVSEVANATAYSYKIGEFEAKSTSPSFIIGETLTPGTYTIYVKAIVDIEGNEKYIDSDYTKLEFSFTATLPRPTVAFSVANPKTIEIASAENVDYYAVTVNGGEEIRVDQTAATTKDLSEYFIEAGSYSIVIIAKSNTTYYNESVPALITYVNRVQLATPVAEFAANDDGYSVSWAAVEHATYYKVVYGENVVYTSATSLQLEEGTTVQVTAVGNGYYDDSAVGSVIVG